MIRFNKKCSWLGSFVVLSALLISGCTASKPVEPSTVPSAPVATQKPAPVETDFHSIQARAETIGRYTVQENWTAIGSFFSRESRQPHQAEDIRRLYTQAYGEKKVEGVQASAARMDDGHLIGYAFLNGDEGRVEVRMIVNERLEIESLGYAKVPATKILEETEQWEEKEFLVGRAPCVHGVLTLPKQVSYPYVALLMPAGLQEEMDASGTDLTFRKDLAHALAERGIASVRWNMRVYEDPLQRGQDGASLKRDVMEDFNYAVHHLENEPVDATNMFYIGHGVSGALGYALVSENFELSKGLVLLDAPYAESGEALYARYAGVENDIAARVTAALEEDESDPNVIYGDQPFWYWKQWHMAGALRYTPRVSMPILILQNEKDETHAGMEDFNSWKSQKGRNVTMYAYRDTQADFRDADGGLSTLAEDIGAWLNGDELISAVKEKEAAQKAGKGGKRT